MENEKEQRKEEFEETDFPPPIEIQRSDRLTRLLSSVQSGWKIAILREQPSWCKGHLETLEVFDPSEEGSAVDVNYLIREWGGHKLFLKVHNERGQWVGGGSISLFSYPPRVHGKLLQEPNYAELLTPAPAPQQNPYPYPPPAAPGPTLDFGKLLDIVMKQKNSDPTMLLKILELQQQQQVQAAPPQQNIVEQFMGMMGLMREMQGMLGEFGGGGGGGGGGDDLGGMLPMVADLLKGLMQKQGQPAPQRRVLTPPQHGGAPVQPLPPAPVQGSTGETLSGIADKLATLDPSDAAEVVLKALGDMPEERRSRAMSIFLNSMGEEEYLDDMSNKDDNSIDGIDNGQP